MRKKYFVAALVVITLILSAGIYAVLAAGTNTATPGSAADPLVTKSYLEQFIMEELQKRAADLEGFELVVIQEGDFLETFSGTELILRAGRAMIVASQRGGISDVTAGRDLAGGVAVPSNHLLITPRSDGRGVLGGNHAQNIFMVRGEYRITRAAAGGADIAEPDPEQAATPALPDEPQEITITAEALRVRSGPGTNYSIIASVHEGQSFTVLEQSGSWYKIQVNNQDGWVYGDFVDINN